MATVYRVRHIQLGSEHALKVLDVPNEALKERLMLEGQLQARLNHPNLVRVTDVVPVAGAFGLVMEFIDGPTLDEWMEAGPRPGETVEERIADTERIFRGILSAVSYAHRKGLVHRDLKPQNVLLEDNDGVLNPKVLDFGIAKLMEDQKAASLTRTGWGMGTPEYMAPEQLKAARDVDTRADIWALGCILYAMFVGKSPFAREDLLQTFAALGTGEHPPLETVRPAVPVRIGDAVRACLQVSRELRVADCSKLSMILAGNLVAPVPEPATEELKSSRGSPPTLSPDDATRYRREPGQAGTREATPAPGLSPTPDILGLTPTPPTPAPLTRIASVTFGPMSSLPGAPPAPAPTPRPVPDTMEFPPGEDDAPEAPPDRRWIAYGAVFAGLLGGAGTLVALALWALTPNPPGAQPEASAVPDPPTAEPAHLAEQEQGTPPIVAPPTRPGPKRGTETVPGAPLSASGAGAAAKLPATEPLAPVPAETPATRPPEEAEPPALQEPAPPEAQPEAPSSGSPLSDPAEITRMVKRVFDKNTGEISACYETNAAAGPGAVWKISLMVDRDGSPSAVAVHSDSGSSPAVESCMTSAVARYRFSPIAEPQPYSRTITFLAPDAAGSGHDALQPVHAPPVEPTQAAPEELEVLLPIGEPPELP